MIKPKTPQGIKLYIQNWNLTSKAWHWIDAGSILVSAPSV